MFSLIIVLLYKLVVLKILYQLSKKYQLFGGKYFMFLQIFIYGKINPTIGYIFFFLLNQIYKI